MDLKTWQRINRTRNSVFARLDMLGAMYLHAGALLYHVHEPEAKAELTKLAELIGAAHAALQIEITNLLVEVTDH